MAINIPIVTEFVDQGLKSAQGAFNNFKTQVGQADSAMGKFKAGGTAAFDAIKANAGAMALGAGAAIAGFAVKAVGEFQALALEVDKFANATGLAAEDASRWIEVAGDIGVEFNTLLTAFNRLNRAVGDNAKGFSELGVEIVRTSSGATDVNATFLKTIDALRKVDDPAKRARLATQLLGKSWTELSELVEMGAGNLKTALDDVSGAKVIDEDEIRKAKDLRAAQDALGDALDDLVLTLGENLIPAFTNATQAAVPFLKVMGQVAEVTLKGADANSSYAEQASKNNIQMRTGIELAKRIFNAFGLFTEEVKVNTLETGRLEAAWKDGYRQMIIARGGVDELTNSLTDADQALAELKGEVNEREAWRNLLDTIEDVRAAALRAFAEATPQALRQSEAALDRARVKAAEYVAGLNSIPPDKKTEIIASLNNANLGQIESILNNLARTRQAQIIAEVFGGTPVTPTPVTPGLPPFAPAPGGGGIKVPTPRPPNRPIAGAYSAVNINVAGSVIAENDLVETVRKGLVNAQRNGAGLVYTNR
jgi:hypothetical protein